MSLKRSVCPIKVKACYNSLTKKLEPDLYPGYIIGYRLKTYLSRVPHFHAIYGEYNGVFEIDTLQMIEGDLPVRAQRLVKEWATQYQADLRAMWTGQEFRQLPGLE